MESVVNAAKDMPYPIGEIVADPSPGLYPQHQTFKGRYVTLEPVDPAKHGDDLYAETHPNDEDTDRIWRYLPEGPCPDRPSFDALLASKAASRDPLFFVVVDNSTGRAVGLQSLLQNVPAHRSTEVGYITYGLSLQKTKGSTEAQYLMARYVFDELRYRRYEWKCNNCNAPSKKAAERFGFTFEGVFRQHMIVKGRNRDTAWFSILDDEWPAIKAGFEAWLDPSNFNERGIQKKTLVECRALAN